MTHLLEALARIQAEYAEMPGLKLTAHQVQRLCGLESALCHAALVALIQRGFLMRAPDGAFLCDQPLAVDRGIIRHMSVS